MNIPSDDGVNVWQQCRTSVGHVTIAALSNYDVGIFELARGVFNNMAGPPDRRDRDTTWIGQAAIFHIAFTAALAAGGAYIGWGSEFPMGGFGYVFDQLVLPAGSYGGTLQGVMRTPAVHPVILNLTAGPITFAYCFRLLPMLPATA